VAAHGGVLLQADRGVPASAGDGEQSRTRLGMNLTLSAGSKVAVTNSTCGDGLARGVLQEVEDVAHDGKPIVWCRGRTERSISYSRVLSQREVGRKCCPWSAYCGVLL
jgi:hypothetical protein